jgi:hypothetical protein
VSKTRLRRSGRLARPNIWRLIILMPRWIVPRLRRCWGASIVAVGRGAFVDAHVAWPGVRDRVIAVEEAVRQARGEPPSLSAWSSPITGFRTRQENLLSGYLTSLDLTDYR